MASPPSGPIIQGVFAIHKPTGISSAQVIRDAQKEFNVSKLFTPWIANETARLDAESHNQKRRRRNRQAGRLKTGHGGTLDPLATGVLILGVGSGTKALSRFLDCTKSYETTVLFGAATDTYDSEGKIVARAPYEQITREKVEEALGQFRGTIMQKPPIYSALRFNGKRLYEYAREGLELPMEIEAREVEVQKVELVEWMEGGEHEWRWPDNEADAEDERAAKRVMGLHDKNGTATVAGKRTRDEETAGENAEPSSKKAKAEPEFATSEIPLHDTSAKSPSEVAVEDTKSEEPQPTITETRAQTPPRCPAPAARIRMTVTSGFYVRSLCHDLGIVLGSMGLMTSLIRTRQRDFDLAAGNVLPYEDLAAGEDVWGPKVREMLENWEAAAAERQQDEPPPVQRTGQMDLQRARERQRNTSSPEP